jgi:hypothetical protein
VKEEIGMKAKMKASIENIWKWRRGRRKEEEEENKWKMKSWRRRDERKW